MRCPGLCRERHSIKRAHTRKTLGHFNQTQGLAHESPPNRPLFSEAELGSDILLVLSIHQFTAGERKFRWRLILRDPVVHVDRSFVAMSFRANKNRTKETGHSRFVELVQRRLSTTDSYPDHFVCAKPSSLSGSHRSEHRLVVESERNPLLKARILGNRDVCCIKRVLSIRFGLRSIDDILARETRCS